jgi:large subunit ribosomal protein L21
MEQPFRTSDSARDNDAEAIVYAIVESGGRQYRAQVGHTIQTEKLPHDVGEILTLDRVLLVSDGDHTVVGMPTVAGASVRATVMDQFRGDKIKILKYKPKNRYRVRQGHRQHYTRLRIDGIVTGSDAQQESE